jgi:hypothetical protein
MNLKSLAAVAMASGMVTSVAAGDAVQWRVEDGGNGHWYRVHIGPPNMTAEQADTVASQVGGHLVTFGSQSETQFVVSLVGGTAATLCPLGPWIGLVQDLNSPDYSEPSGGWRWVDGTEAPIAWGQGGPNNNCFGIPENRGNMWFDGLINDLAADPECVGYWPNGAINSAVIEWSSDCNSDGIVDYGQILNGELADANGNGVPDICEQSPCPGDIATDGVVNGVDLAAILNNWGTTGGALGADANGDGVVDGADLALVLNSWGPCPK